MIGAGPALKRCKTLVTALGLAGVVNFTGHIEDPTAVLANANLFVLLSSHEGISNALLEAMQAGIPVYATLAGGHDEFMKDGENSFVARSRNPARVAKDLERILQHEQLVETGREGNRIAEQLFGLQRMGDQLEALLEQVCRKHGRASPNRPHIART